MGREAFQRAAELSLSAPLQLQQPSPPHSQLPVLREDVELDIDALSVLTRTPPLTGRVMCSDGVAWFPLENHKMH